MAEILAVLPLAGDAGIVGFGGVLVLLVLMGKLVPRSTLKDQQKATDEWRKIAMVREETLRLKEDQLNELLPSLRTVVAFIQSIGAPSVSDTGSNREEAAVGSDQ